MYIISFIKRQLKQALDKPRQKNQPNFSLTNYKEKYDTLLGDIAIYILPLNGVALVSSP